MARSFSSEFPLEIALGTCSRAYRLRRLAQSVVNGLEWAVLYPDLYVRYLDILDSVTVDGYR